MTPMTMHTRVADSLQLARGFDLYRYLESQAEVAAVRRFGPGYRVQMLSCCMSDMPAPIFRHASLVVLSKWKITPGAPVVQPD